MEHNCEASKMSDRHPLQIPSLSVPVAGFFKYTPSGIDALARGDIPEQEMHTP